MSFNLVRNIVSQPWAINPEYVDSVIPFIVSLLTNSNPQWEQRKESVSMISVDARGKQGARNNEKTESVAIVPLVGPLMKNDQFCGPVGTATIGQYLKDLDANQSVVGIVLKIDSPGGTVDGTEHLAQIVASLQTPIVAYVDGMMASAAMWIGSAAKKIFISGKTNIVGSIGTMTSIMDVQPMLEKAGVKFHTIRATESEHKNLDVEKVLVKSDYKDYRAGILDPLNSVFLNAIKTNRSGKIDIEKENVLTGKVYIGDKAIDVGLADERGTIDDAINAVRDMASNNQSQKASMEFPEILKASNSEDIMPVIAGVAVTHNGYFMTTEQMQAVENALGKGTTSTTELGTALQTIADLKLSQNNLQEKVTNVTEQLQTANETVKTLQAKVVALGATTDQPDDTSKDDDDYDDGKTPKLNSMDRLAKSRGIPR
jgi:signal peptide peptidase SppA